jgi:hypothetical protein
MKSKRHPRVRRIILDGDVHDMCPQRPAPEMPNQSSIVLPHGDLQARRPLLPLVQPQIQKQPIKLPDVPSYFEVPAVAGGMIDSGLLEGNDGQFAVCWPADMGESFEFQDYSTG